MFLRQVRSVLGVASATLLRPVAPAARPLSPFSMQISNFSTTFKPAARAAAKLKERLGPQPSPLQEPTAAAPREGPGALTRGFGGPRTSPGAGRGGASKGAAPRKATGSRSKDLVKKTTLSESTGLITRVVHIGRVSRMTGQGRKTQFRALVVMGNGRGAVGFGVGKGLNPRTALVSAVREGEKDLVVIDVAPWGSLYHDLQGKCNNTRVMIRAVPAHKWYATAGKLMKSIMECAGISTYSCKILGRRNPFSIVNAAFDALGKHQTPKEIAYKRGRKLVDKANPHLLDNVH